LEPHEGVGVLLQHLPAALRAEVVPRDEGEQLLACDVHVCARKLLEPISLAGQHELEEDPHRVLVGAELPRGDAGNEVGDRGWVK